MQIKLWWWVNSRNLLVFNFAILVKAWKLRKFDACECKKKNRWLSGDGRGNGATHDASPDPNLDPDGSHFHPAIRAFGSSWIAVPELWSRYARSALWVWQLRYLASPSPVFCD